MTDAPLTPAYFEDLYAANPDPWGFTDRWYESRKRAITIASLPRARFRRAFEPGCSIGLLSEQLADRCDELVSADVSLTAVRSAQARLANRPGVQVQQLRIPQEWPEGQFDLIIVSELAYYSDEIGAQSLGRQAAASLTADGVLLLCHWLHPVADYPLPGEVAQRLVREASGLHTLVCHQEDDFRLEVLAVSTMQSVAAAEGLTTEP